MYHYFRNAGLDNDLKFLGNDRLKMITLDSRRRQIQKYGKIKLFWFINQFIAKPDVQRQAFSDLA